MICTAEKCKAMKEACEEYGASMVRGPKQRDLGQWAGLREKERLRRGKRGWTHFVGVTDIGKKVGWHS